MKEEFYLYIVSLYKDVPEWVYEGLVSVFCLGAVLMLALWGFKKGLRKSSGLLFVEYVFLVFCSTVIFRTANEGRGHNFHPFWSYAAIQEGRENLLPENIMNVAAFVPIGLLSGWAFKLKWWQVLIIGFVISLSIETLQYVSKRGFAEFDDVMHNTLGCMIGYGIYALVSNVRPFGLVSGKK